ncbi:MAG: AgmX/PglI C-terminal domain-containing protein [Deltaproteobacteria bacterium]|nr:AgmX/PglI C-terminal domain-containing protein [Deltaproteobacteria bacterium]
MKVLRSCCWPLLLALACSCEPPAARTAPPALSSAPPSSALSGPPLVEVRRSGVLLDRKLVVPAPDPKSPAEPGPIESLTRALRSRPIPPALAASARGMVSVEFDADAPGWLLASVIQSGVGAAYETSSIRAPRGTLLVRNALPQGKWMEPEAGRTDLVLLAGPDRVTAVRATGAGKPEDALFEFEAFARESPAAFQPAYDAVSKLASRACGSTADDCPRFVQVRLHAPMSSGELVALIDSATPAGPRGAGDRPVQIAFVSSSPAGRNQSLPLFVLQGIIQKHAAQFHKCYEPAAARDPRLTGRVVVKLTIDREGLVSDVQDVSETYGSASAPGRPVANQPFADMTVRSCVVERYKTLRFPPPPGGMLTVTWPMFFSPEKRQEVSEELR